MFCCFRGLPAAEGKVLFSDLRPPQKDEAPSSTVSGEPGKAAALLELVTSTPNEGPTKGTHARLNGGEVVSIDAPEHQEDGPAEPVQKSYGIWTSLAEGLRTNTGNQLTSMAGAGAQVNGDAALRLPPVGDVIALSDLVQQISNLGDPVAIITFDRTTKRSLRSHRVSPHLVMDINMEAMFAGGVVSPPCMTNTSCGEQSLEPLGHLSPQAVLHLLQRHYCNAEAIRLAVHCTNPALQSLLGCPGEGDYEGLLGELLSTEHMMRAVLHDCCLCMLEGVGAANAQLMVHHPIRSTASRMVLPVMVQPLLVWRRSPGAPATAAEVPTMAVVVRYTLSAGLHDALQQLHRVYVMLSSLSGIVTLFTLRGLVLHQNAASVRYMGLRTALGPEAIGLANATNAGAGGGGGGGGGTDIQQSADLTDASGLALGSLLRQIFALSSEQLDDMLEDVVEGKTWKGIVRVPPLLTPTTDPGPVQAAVLVARGMSAMTGGPTPNGSNAQVMSTWERLGPVLMSTQPGVRCSVAQNGNQSDAEGHSDMVGALMLTQEADKSLGGPVDAAAAAGSTITGSTAGGTIMALPGTTASVLRTNASTLGAGGGGGDRNVNSGGGGGGDTGSTPGSCLFLAMGSTSGTTFSRMNAGSHLGTQNSFLRMGVHQRTLMSRLSSNDLPEGGSLATALSMPGPGGGGGSGRSGGNGGIGGGSGMMSTGATVGSTAAAGKSSGNGGSTAGSLYVASKLSGSAPVVPSNSRAQSAVRIAGTSLLRTLMENGTSIMSEMDRASNSIGYLSGLAGPTGTGSGGLPEDGLQRRQQQQPGLTDAARRSIVRRRSALKLVPSPSDDNPLSTSTWGLFESSRVRGESKSFTLRRTNSPSAPNGIKRVGTDRTLEHMKAAPSHTEPQTGSAAAVASTVTAGSLTSGGGGAKKRPPSRLMSFLANKNIGGAPTAASHSARSITTTGGGNVWSTSVVGEGGSAHDGGGAAAGGGGGGGGPSSFKGVCSTTELEIGSRQGSSLGRSGLSTLAVQQHLASNAAMLETAAQNGSANNATAAASASARAGSPRRPPARRVMRPAIADVAEESGAECSGRLPLMVAAARESGVSTAAGPPAVLPQLSAVMQASRASTASQVPGREMTHPSYGGGSQDRASCSCDDDEDCWHEITASTLRDPVSGEQALLLMQVDVSARVRAERRIAEVLEAEHKLLESVFPRHVLELAATQHPKNGAGRQGLGAMSKFSLAELPLVQNCASVATYHPMVTILFSDIVGFTSMCHEIPATKVMEFLNNLYSRLDTLLDVYGVYKVETIGDCYMVAGGLMTRDADGFMTVRGSDSTDELHAAKVMSFAKAMLRETSEVLLPTTGQPVQMRIGLHSGPVMSGIVGSKMPRFCLFGDTVNTASRMESTCPPGCIHVSGATREFLLDEDWEPTGGVMVKGKGVMETFRWVPLDAETSPQIRATGSQRHNRPRRASSIAYIHTGCGGGVGVGVGVGGGGGWTFGVGGTGGPSRDGSGSISLAQQAAQTVGSGPMGLTSATGSCGMNSAASNAVHFSAQGGCAWPYTGPAKGHRAASASIAFMGTATGSAAGQGPGTPMGATAAAADAAAAAAAAAVAVTPAATPAVSLTGQPPRVGRTTGSSGVGPGSGTLVSTRRKPHRSCSTTALAYRGLARPA